MASTYFQTPVVTLTTTEHILLLGVDEKMPQEERLALSALLLSRFNKAQVSSLSSLENLLACFAPLFPGLMTHLATMKSVSTSVVPLTSQMIEGLLDSNPKKAGAATVFLTRPAPDTGALAVDSSDGVHAGLASVLMALGKDAGNNVDANVMKARPKALIERFNIPEEQQLLLPGRAYGPSQSSMACLYNSFSAYSEIRMKVAQYMLGMASSAGHLPRGAEILMNNFRLLRGAQMSHVTAIVKFMNMHPWSVRVPELRPYYQKFADELGLFDAVPAPVRQYHRLLVPQSEFLFVSAEYRPLIAVAGDFVKEVEATFGAYIYNASDYTALIQKVRQHAPDDARYVGASLLASMLNIQDQELPPVRPTEPTAPPAML